jgi:hypothetical protein
MRLDNPIDRTGSCAPHMARIDTDIIEDVILEVGEKEMRATARSTLPQTGDDAEYR